MEQQDGNSVERLMRYFDSLRRAAPDVDPSALHEASALPGILLLPDQFMYAVDYDRSELFAAQGFERVLGYPDHEVDLRSIFTYIHPDDAPAVTAIVERALRQLFVAPISVLPFSSVMSLDYRIRKANGSYIKMLRQVTVLGVHPNGRAISTLSICKDISNIKQSDRIGWQGCGPGTENMDMSDLLTDHPNVLYRPSPRELDILALLALGKSSKVIAAELDIRVHTVNTHRKNLLQRTGALNSAALIRLAVEHGWVRNSTA